MTTHTVSPAEMGPLLESGTAKKAKDDIHLSDLITGQTTLHIGGHDVLGTEQEIGEDAWGAATMAIIRNTTEIGVLRQKGEDYRLNVVRLCTCLIVAAMNLAMQFLILYYIHAYVVEPSVRQLQLLYRDFRGSVYTEEGVFDESRWKVYERKSEVCGITIINQPFYFSIMLLWALTCLAEIRAAERIMRNVMNIERVEKPEDMLIYESEGIFEGDTHIIALTFGRKVGIWILVIIPRVCIASYLGWLGARWLSASASFSDMVLNSLALGFVIAIDELLFQSVLPVPVRKQIQETKFFFKEGSKKLTQVEAAEWKGYSRTFMWVSVAVILMASYGQFLQAVLPPKIGHLRHTCHFHNAKEEIPICQSFAFQGIDPKCYPNNKVLGK